MVNERALILEGGGMRGVFTAGVLDFFLDNNIDFPYVIGVSAGCTNACSYISRQRGRSIYINTTLLDEHNFMGVRAFLKSGTFVDVDFLYNELLYEIYPFDLATFRANKTIFEAVTTNALTGKACYLSKPNDLDELVAICQASGCLPIVNKVVEINGVPMVDGGVSDSLPLERAFSLGYKRALVVSTQCRGFRKKVSRIKIPKFMYSKYPKIVEMLNNRPIHYNKQMEFVEKLEDEGRISVIRPTKSLVVGRFTTNTQRLRELYEQGYTAARVWNALNHL